MNIIFVYKHKHIIHFKKEKIYVTTVELSTLKLRLHVYEVILLQQNCLQLSWFYFYCRNIELYCIVIYLLNLYLFQLNILARQKSLFIPFNNYVQTYNHVHLIIYTKLHS